MKHPFLPATSLAFLAACAGGASPTAAQSQKLEEARQALLQNGDPDGALAITDQLLAAEPSWREARIVAADSFVQLSKADRRGLNRELVLGDAQSAYERALALDPKDAATWLKLAEVRYELGMFASARTAALEALQQFEQKKAKLVEMTAPVLVAVRCDLQELARARAEEWKEGEKDERGFVKVKPETAAIAVSALQKLQPVLGLVPEAAYGLAAQVYQQLGQNEQALTELERGIRQAPDAGDLHVRFQQLHSELGQSRALAGAYSRLLRENPTVPILRWYQGRALVVVADDLRQKGNFEGALDGYGKAIAAFGEYGSMMPGHAEATGQWLAICELSSARVACDTGDLAGAQKHLLAAEQASPLTATYENNDPLKPALLDSFRSHYCGVVGAISRALAAGGDGALQQTLAFNEGVLQRHPEQWGFVYNNAALPARDLGVLLTRDLEQKSEAERKAAMAQAMELWERSYRYYEIAAKLSPDDPRIVNDAGLMLIYHLNRDFDRARAYFDQAIAKGQPQLDALAADASEDERNFLEEAIGDAWQNIAVLMVRHQHRPFAEVKPFLEKAVTYYPKARREAAHMLANEGRETPDNGANPRSLRAAQGQGGNEAVTKARAEAEQKAKDGDLDGALAALDQALSKDKTLKGNAAFQLLRGDFNLRYARQAAQDKRKGTDLLFEDAVAALKKAVELDSDPAAPRQLLAEALYDKGDLAGSVRTASELLLHLQSQGGGKPAELEAAHKVRANAGARLYAAQMSEKKDDKQLLADARTSLRYLEQKATIDAELRKTWAAMETWAGAAPEAVGVYARALAKTPDDQALLGAVIDTAVQAGQAAAAVDALKARDDAAGLWYLGKARFFAANDLRTGGKNPEALAELDRARECFDKSMAKNKDFTASCTQWIAICLGKKGTTAFAMDKFDDAEKWLLEACRLQPDRIGDDLGLQETTKLGIQRLADKYFRARDLGRAASICIAAAEAANSDLDLLNNAGLFARDHGNEVEAAGKQKEAKALYEQSYKSYQRAHQLDPNNVRLANDTALIAIWYLERDWEQTKPMLEAAIAEGDKQLPTIGADKPQDRKDLDEAIGDAWENLALWHIKQSKDGAAAKKAALESQKHHPGAGRPGARRHLAEAEKLLSGKGAGEKGK